MSRPARMLTGRPATDDLDSSMGTDTETTMLPVIVGYSNSARGCSAFCTSSSFNLAASSLVCSVRASSDGATVARRLGRRNGAGSGGSALRWPARVRVREGFSLPALLPLRALAYALLCSSSRICRKSSAIAMTADIEANSTRRPGRYASRTKV
jgi:hypothetical protein